MQEIWFLCMARHLNVLYKCMKFCSNYSNGYQAIEQILFCDGQTDALTVGYFLGTYSVRKSSKESVCTQQIHVNFYGINLILSN